MREFFRGWKRKVGCVTLVVACVFMVGWVRSLFVYDHVDWDIPARKCSWGVRNGNGELEVNYDWVNKGELPRLPGVAWTTDKVDDHLKPRLMTISLFKGWWFLGNDRIERKSLSIRYWIVVTPLTLLSAWLLLSKPKAERPQIEPII